MRQAVTAEEPGTFELVNVEPDDLDPGDVRIRVEATGICGSDLHWVHAPERWQPGRVIGHEFAGEIIELGSLVKGWSVGERVAVMPGRMCGTCPNCHAGRYQLCDRLSDLFGLTVPGGLSESLNLPPQALFRLPETVSYALGAMTEPLAVAVHGFRLAARLDPDRPTSGERVVVLGAGIIGLLSVFYAKRAGSREVAVTAKYPFQAEAAVAMGADHVFGTNKTAQDELAEWAATHPVDVVIETVGGAANTPAEATRIVRSGGRIALLGIFTNDIVLPSAGLTLKEPRIVFPFGYSYIGPHADYQIAVDLLGDEPELLGSLITHRFSLDSVAEMMQTATDKAATGAIKVVVEH